MQIITQQDYRLIHQTNDLTMLSLRPLVLLINGGT